MITSRTIQLLDANNNNISPATSIESLYFEKTSSDGVTYRLGVKDRLVVAGKDVVLNSSNFDSLNFPYLYITKVEGAGTVYQFNSGTTNLQEPIDKYVDTNFKDRYISNNDAKNKYVSRTNDSSNNIIDPLYFSSNETGYTSDYKLRIGKAGDNSIGIAWNENNYIYGSSDDKMTLKNQTSIELDAPSVNITGSTSISLGQSTTDFDITAKSFKVAKSDKYIELTEESNVNISASNINITANASIVLNAPGTNNGVYIPSGTMLSIYDKPFPSYNELTGKKKYLTYTPDSRELAWERIDNIKEEENIVTNESIGSLLKKINFGDSLDVSLLGDDKINIKTLRDSSVGTIYSLNGSNTISFARINGNAVIDTDKDFNLAKADTSVWKNLTASDGEFIKVKDSTDSTTTEIIHLCGNINYNTTNGQITLSKNKNVYIDENGLHAPNFYKSSDVRLKTDIREPDFTDITVPEIHQFVFTDSSALSYGVIAQELETNGLAHLVSTNDSGMKSVDYTALLCLMVRDLQRKNSALEARISQLETQTVKNV